MRWTGKRSCCRSHSTNIIRLAHLETMKLTRKFSLAPMGVLVPCVCLTWLTKCPSARPRAKVSFSFSFSFRLKRQWLDNGFSFRFKRLVRQWLEIQFEIQFHIQFQIQFQIQVWDSIPHSVSVSDSGSRLSSSLFQIQLQIQIGVKITFYLISDCFRFKIKLRLSSNELH